MEKCQAVADFKGELTKALDENFPIKHAGTRTGEVIFEFAPIGDKYQGASLVQSDSGEWLVIVEKVFAVNDVRKFDQRIWYTEHARYEQATKVFAHAVNNFDTLQ